MTKTRRHRRNEDEDEDAATASSSSSDKAIDAMLSFIQKMDQRAEEERKERAEWMKLMLETRTPAPEKPPPTAPPSSDFFNRNFPSTTSVSSTTTEHSAPSNEPANYTTATISNPTYSTAGSTGYTTARTVPQTTYAAGFPYDTVYRPAYSAYVPPQCVTSPSIQPQNGLSSSVGYPGGPTPAFSYSNAGYYPVNSYMPSMPVSHTSPSFIPNPSFVPPPLFPGFSTMGPNLHQAYAINSTLQPCPPFKEDGKISPEKFVKKFNDVFEGMDAREKVRLFQCLVQVENSEWDDGLSCQRNSLTEFQERFLNAFSSRELQEIVLRQFEETPLSYTNATEFLHQLDYWYNRLIALTHLHLRPSDIINKLIDKLPNSKRDLLRLIDYKNFAEFKQKVVRITHARDFEPKGGRNDDRSGVGGKRDNQFNNRGPYNGRNNRDSNNEYNNYGYNKNNPSYEKAQQGTLRENNDPDTYPDGNSNRNSSRRGNNNPTNRNHNYNNNNNNNNSNNNSRNDNYRVNYSNREAPVQRGACDDDPSLSRNPGEHRFTGTGGRSQNSSGSESQNSTNRNAGPSVNPPNNRQNGPEN